MKDVLDKTLIVNRVWNFIISEKVWTVRYKKSSEQSKNHITPTGLHLCIEEERRFEEILHTVEVTESKV